MYKINRALDILRSHGLRSLLGALRRYLLFTLVESEAYYEKRFELRRILVCFRYGEIPHAFSLIHVDPNDIKAVSGTDPLRKWSQAGTVAGGDWDRTEEKFVEYDLYQALQERFEEGCEWKETKFYDRVASQICEGKTKWGCSSLEEFDERCRDIDDLYASIRDHGYRSKREIASTDADIPVTDAHTITSSSPLAKYDEVAIDIGRDGELLFVDGRHRLAIAKILDIERIPVRVVKRHVGWQEKRLAKPDDNGTDHPDL